MNFDQAFTVLLGHEGGYSDHRDDPGGKTMYGVAEDTARAEGYTGEMNALPLDVAKRIYRKRYWDAVRADELPAPLRYPMFDAAVNSGPRQAIRWLQRAVLVADDGAFGPKTLAAVMQHDPHALRSQILGQRLRFMASLGAWPSFGRGWAKRIASLLEDA